MPCSILCPRTPRGADIVALVIGMSLLSLFFCVSPALDGLSPR